MATNYIIRTNTLESFGTLGDWTASSGSIAMSSGKLQLTATSGGNCIASKTINTTVNGNLKLNIYIEDSTTLASLDSVYLILSSTSGYTSYFQRINFSSNLHEGNNELIVNPSNFTNEGAGTESFANTMVRLRIRINAKPGLNCSIRFDDLKSSFYSRPKCLFHFDDGYATVYTTALPLMRKYNFKGTTYVNSSFVETNGSYLTLAQLNDLHNNYGWDIGNHTKTHFHMDQQTTATNEAEVDATNTYLISRGFTRRNEHKHFVYPYGDYSQAVMDVLATRGILTARNTLTARTQANSLDNNLQLNWQGLTVGDAAAAMAAVDRTIADGGCIMFGFHSIVAVPGQSYEWDTASFTTLTDYIAKKANLIDVVTITDWYGGLFGNRRIS
jgi:peptidoglycan/xylan/chitin deacetylase (PgdA/CDA1 family)